MFPKRFASLVPFFVVMVMVALSFIPLGVVRAITCDVPTATYPTIQSAVNDTSCDTINLTNPPGSPYFEHVTIDNRTVTIQGEGTASTAVDGSNSATVFTIQAGAVVTLTNLTIQNGNGLSSAFGGGIFNAGSATIISSTLSNNLAVFGAGIYNLGIITVTNSTLNNNAASQNAGGGGIFNLGTVTLTNSNLSGNSAAYGGGIANNDGTLIMTDSTLSGNWAGNWGGGISNGFFNSFGIMTVINSVLNDNSAYSGGGIFGIVGTLTMTNSTLRANSATSGGGGMFNLENTMTLVNSVLDDNTAQWGGGIFNNTNGALSLTNSTVSDNLAINPYSLGAGGGIQNWGTVSITNSTLSGNSTQQYGGAISNGNTVTMTNSTLSDNSASSGNGIYNYYTSSVTTVSNSIIANSLTGGNCSGSASVASLGHNIASDASCNLTGPGDLPNIAPLLGPLQDNGGPTLTHAPLAGSPAIDAGDNGVCPSTDQRGFPRPLDGDGNGIAICDIGSVENDGPIGEPDPQQAIEALIADVQSLVDAGVLNPNVGAALIARLETAIQRLNQGDVTGAIRQLQIFIYKIERLILRGVLAPEQGQPLIQAANEIIEDLNSP